MCLMCIGKIDALGSTLREHQECIVRKLVDIVGDFIESAAVNSLKSVDWDHMPNGQHGSSDGSSTLRLCEYLEEVLKNLTALHRVLCSTFPVEQVQDVFTRIFSLMSRKIPLNLAEHRCV